MKKLPKDFRAMFMKSFWLIVPLIVIVAVTWADAQVSSVTVAVDGMSCPFCAFGVEKKLKEVDGVGSAKVDLKSGTASLSAAEGETIYVDQVPEAIKKAGFTAGTIQVTASGKISVDDRNRPLVNIHGSQQKFILVNLKNDTKKRLEALTKNDALVEVAGIFHQAVDDIPGITPERMKEVSK